MYLLGCLMSKSKQHNNMGRHTSKNTCRRCGFTSSSGYNIMPCMIGSHSHHCPKCIVYVPSLETAACRDCIERIRFALMDKITNEGDHGSDTCRLCIRKAHHDDLIYLRGISIICIACAYELTHNHACDIMTDSGLQSLPNEILDHVWSYLSVREILEAQSVSKQFFLLGANEDRWKMEREKILSKDGLCVNEQREFRLRAMHYRDLHAYVKRCVYVSFEDTRSDVNKLVLVNPSDTIDEVFSYGWCQKFDKVNVKILSGNIIPCYVQIYTLHHTNELKIGRVSVNLTHASITFNGRHASIRGYEGTHWNLQSPACIRSHHTDLPMDHKESSPIVIGCPICQDYIITERNHLEYNRSEIALFTGEIEYDRSFNVVRYEDTIVTSELTETIKASIVREIGSRAQKANWTWSFERGNDRTNHVMFRLDNQKEMRVCVYLTPK
jgi:hypothetical protein